MVHKNLVSKQKCSWITIHMYLASVTGRQVCNVSLNKSLAITIGSNQSSGQALDVTQEECAVDKCQQVGGEDREELHFTSSSQLIPDGSLRAEMNRITLS